MRKALLRMLFRCSVALLIPISLSLGQSSRIRPYGTAATGFGFMKYADGRTSALEAGLMVKRHFAVGIDRMQFYEGAEESRWTLANLRAYPFGLGRSGGLWLAAGAGRASARQTETVTALSSTLYRFSGAGVKGSIGADLRVVDHLFLTPSVSVRHSLGSAESSSCTHAFGGPTTCSAWGSATYPFQAVDLAIALTLR